MSRFLLAAALVAGLVVTPAAQRGPAPASTKLPDDVIALACAPRATFDMPEHPLRVTGGQDSVERRTFAPGDLVTINAGTNNGIEVGQEFFARRVQRKGRLRPSLANPANVRTSGWLRVYAVDDDMSLATITHACETVDVGDYLEPFALPAVPVAAEMLPPEKSNYGRILYGDDQRRAIGKGEFFVIDRGSDHGVTPGARFVVYHDKQIPGNFLYEVGEAMAVDVQPQTSTLQALVSRDAFLAGDYVARRK